jgi:hypothetical protein
MTHTHTARVCWQRQAHTSVFVQLLHAFWICMMVCAPFALHHSNVQYQQVQVLILTGTIIPCFGSISAASLCLSSAGWLACCDPVLL